MSMAKSNKTYFVIQVYILCRSGRKKQGVKCETIENKESCIRAIALATKNLILEGFLFEGTSVINFLNCVLRSNTNIGNDWSSNSGRNRSQLLKRLFPEMSADLM